MSSLKNEPSQPVRSLEELFAIAYAMEDEAARRYSQIAERLREEHNIALAEVFERLVAEECGHMDEVVRWFEREKGKAPEPELIRRPLPETFDDEGMATADPRLLTAYRSLAMAVRNEERAFAFWSYVVAHAEDPAIRRAAETMAREELDHVATLRRERRRAFHEERVSAPVAEASPPPDSATLERRLAELLDRLAPEASPMISRLAEEARTHAEQLARNPLDTARATAREIPDDAVVISEILVDRYLEAAEDLRDEASVARAQALAGRAINRLAWLRADLPEIDRDHP